MGRIRQKSLSWSIRFLSRAGKLTMMKAILTAIPTYTVSCFQIPVGLCKRIQAVLTRFWWDNSNGNKKICWVSWERMMKPKAVGRVGFRDIQLFIQAMLVKLAWRIITVRIVYWLVFLKGNIVKDMVFETQIYLVPSFMDGEASCLEGIL